MASLMLVETEDLIPVIATIICPIFSAMMALRYPTQPLRVAASTPTLSILHFVDPQDDARPPNSKMLVRDFANFRPPMAYTIIKDKKQVEHNFVTSIRSRARCALPMPLELHPVEWLHAPINPNTGTLQDFSSWDDPEILRVLTNAVQRLGGQRKGATLEKIQHKNIQDTSRMYNPRTKRPDNTAVTLTTISCWANPPVVDQTIYQNYQVLNAMTPRIAKEPIRKVLPISAEAPNNPKMARKIFMKLIAKQQEENSSVYADYLTAVETYKNVFKRYGRQDLADQLPERCPVGSTSERQAAGHEENSAGGSTTSVVSTMTQGDTLPVTATARMDVSTSNPNQISQIPENDTIASDNDATMLPDSLDDVPVSISQTEAADIELELNELPSLDAQDLPLMDMLTETPGEAPQEQVNPVEDSSSEQCEY